MSSSEKSEFLSLPIPASLVTLWVEAAAPDQWEESISGTDQSEASVQYIGQSEARIQNIDQSDASIESVDQ